MKVASLSLILILMVASILFVPQVAAQNDEENADDSACILTSFCIVIFIVLFLFYLSVKKKARDQMEPTAPTQSGYPPPQPGYRYPPPGLGAQPYGMARTQDQPVQVEVKCDLCSSKNLRSFEDGYFKCNECRHVFFISEMQKRRPRTPSPP